MPNLVPSSEVRKALGGPLRRVLMEALREKALSLFTDADIEDRLARLQHKALNAYGYDPFGYNPQALRLILRPSRFLYRYYFRTEVFGLEHLPKEGGMLLVANHSGQLPIDGFIIGLSMFLEAEPPRIVRSMVERFVPRLPWFNVMMSRWGQILGEPQNCIRLLESDETVLVFPEGSRGISKPRADAYKLTEFGTGFMRMAIRTGKPVVPIAVVGGEEQYIRLADMRGLAKLLDLPAVPLFPLGPLPVPGGLLPLPVRYRLHFGPPMSFDGDPDDDDATIGRKVKKVKSTIQRMLHTGLGQRRAVFW